MIDSKDKEYLTSLDYDMALEKFYYPDYFRKLDAKQKNGTIRFAYPFSNENLAKLFPYLPIRNGNLLTVGSSGDQVLNGIYYGAKSITVVDANLYTEPFIMYKISAIKNLSFNEFKSFIMHGNNAFHYKVYRKISHDIPVQVRTFWDTIILNQDYAESTDVAILFRGDVTSKQIRSEFYKNEANYNYLKKLLNENNYSLNFITRCFNEFPYALRDKYDVILLSNVARYVKPEEYREVERALYFNNLKPNGVMQTYYVFDINGKSSKVELKKYLLAQEESSEVASSRRVLNLDKDETVIVKKEKNFEME